MRPELYACDAVTFRMLPELLEGNASASPDAAGANIAAMRNHVGRAPIGDERNGENLLMAQIHLLFIKFHHAVVTHLRAKRPRTSPARVRRSSTGRNASSPGIISGSCCSTLSSDSPSPGLSIRFVSVASRVLPLPKDVLHVG